MEEEKKKKTTKRLIIFIIVVVILAICVAISNEDDTTNTNNNVLNSIVDNTTTTNNSVSNSIVEVSDISFTGMRFKTTWTELKNKIDEFNSKDELNNFVLSDWVDTTEITGTTSHAITFKRIRNSTFSDAFGFSIITENSSDKVISIEYSFLKTESMSEYLEEFMAYLSFIDPTLVNEFVEFYEQSSQASDIKSATTYYKDNVFMYIYVGSSNYSIIISPATDEKATYFKENGSWKSLK